VKWREVLSLKAKRRHEHHNLYLLYFTVCWHFHSHWSQNIHQMNLSKQGQLGVWSFHIGVINVWSSGMWHSCHRECSEPVGQRCRVTSAKPRITFHTPIFWHVTPYQLTYSYERIRGPSCLHLNAPSLLTPWTDRQTDRQTATPSEI
jgi:hypothetical protein